MVDNLQRLAAHGGRSQGARLLAAHKDKNLGSRPTGAGATPAYRSTHQTNSVLPFPVLVAPSPVVQSMPSRRDGVLPNREGSSLWGAGYRDPCEMDDDGEDDENNNPVAVSGKGPGVTVGKRRVLGGSEAKKQAQLPTLFSRENKRQLTARLVPAGMVNLGNTCYLNSVVQVLLNMTNFMGDLRDPTLERISQHLPVAGVWAALRTTADKLRTASEARLTFDSLKPAVEPSELRVAMGRRGSRWRSFAQQDAHEFLVELLEGLQSEVLAAEAAASGRRRMPLSQTRCPAARNLSGCLMHTWTCSVCGCCTRVKEPFSCLSLQLPPQGAVNLQDLVSEYLKDETIDKNCDGCSPSAAVPHTAQHHFWRLPRVLVVHIKRFMPLPQQQHTQPQTQQYQASQGQGPSGGGVGGPVASAAVPAAGQPESLAPASTLNVPGTPNRGDAAAARVPAAAVEVQPSAPAPQQQATAAGSRDASPPAPYLYAKVHTVVKVTAGMDLARHCDAAARAHVHLLEILPSDAGARRACDSDDGAAAAGGSAERWPGGNGGDGKGAAGAVATVGTTTGHTLDTAGGGSTCPSPSFLQPNASVLQERTVQQHGTALPPRDQLRRSILGGSKAVTPGGVRLRVSDSDCGTSAISTGAQADAGGGAPTPHGGCVAGASLPGSLGRQTVQDRRLSPLGGAGAGSRMAGPGSGLDAQPRMGQCGGQVEQPETGPFSPSHAPLRPAGKDLGLSQPASQLTPGPGLSSRTGNDRHGPALPPGSTSRGGAACSERKAPRPVAAGAFFGGAPAVEPQTVGRSALGGACGGGGAGLSQPCNGGPPVRPHKRVCVEDTTAASTGRRASEPLGSAPEALAPQRLEEMTEEEQFQLALRMSLVEDHGHAGGCDDEGAGGGRRGTEARQSSGAGPAAPPARTAEGSGPLAPGSREAPLDLSIPTAATTVRQGRTSGGGTRRGRASGDSTGGGHGMRGVTPSLPDDDTAGDNEDVIELQDESQGGCGSGRAGDAGDGGGRGAYDSHRLTNSGPALSGASGGRDDGVESDCSAGQVAAARVGRGGTGLDRRQAARRAVKRRVANLFGHEGVPEVAESPAVPPPHPQRRRTDNDYYLDGDAQGDLRVACSVDDEDDCTTALSPVSRGAKALAMGGAGGRGANDRRDASTGAGACDAPDADEHDVQPAPAADVEMFPADEDPDIAKALKESMKTYEAEEEARRASERKSQTDNEWMRMLGIPEPNCDSPGPSMPDFEAQAAAAGGGCATPRRCSAADGAAEVPNAQPPPLRRRSGAECPGSSRLGTSGAADDDGGRGAGIDALVAAACLGSTGATAATARRPPSLARRNSAMDVDGAGDAAGTSSGFKFGFQMPDATAEGGPASGAAGLGGPGSRREEALDLTGGDDEDADLHQAIMLSLQEDNGILDGVVGAAAQAVMDLAGAEEVDANDAAPEPDKPKVFLVPDSDYEDDKSDDEAADGNAGPAAVNTAETEPASAAQGVAVVANKTRNHARGGPSGVGASVPLAQLARYRLHGVVRHKGLTPFSGHYVADVLVTTPSGANGQPTQVWYEHNDAIVSHVDFDRVREDAAKQGYLFFFVNAPKPFSSLAAALAAAAAKPLPGDEQAAGGA